MIQGKLMLHRGARFVQLDELEKVPTPPATDTWFPVPHHAIVQNVVNCLDGAGYRVEKMELGLSRDDARFFGTLTLQNRIATDVSLAVGIRSSHDKSFPLGFCCGSRVFCCDNLSFFSELPVVTRRHTRFGETRYVEATARVLLELHQHQLAASKWIEHLQACELSSEAADSLLLRSFEAGIVSSRLLEPVLKEWRNPRHEEFRPRTAWSLLNAFTECFKERQKSNPQEAAYQTIRLNRLLAPTGEVVYGDDTQQQPTIGT